MGRFVWYELLTTDTEGAKSFYADLIGWKVKHDPDGYDEWRVGEGSIGGVMELPTDARAGGASPFWLGYVAVEDVDAAADQAAKLGGRVHRAPADIPGVGRFAVLADPQGASFAVYRSQDPHEAPAASGPGIFGWSELNTTDWKSAWRFYSALLGWKPTQSIDMGKEHGEYFMFGADPKSSIGGMSNAASAAGVSAHWLHYVLVPDADEAAKRIDRLGGKVLNGPMEVPGGDRVAQCRDPQGAHFGIFSAKR